MPRIQWTNLPASSRDHLLDWLAERKITAEDLYSLKVWRGSEPEAPDGPWHKDFGSFKIAGKESSRSRSFSEARLRGARRFEVRSAKNRTLANSARMSL